MKNKLELETISGIYSIHQMPAGASIPEISSGFYSITRTSDEVSIVCLDEMEINSISCSKGWKGLRVSGTLEFDLVGILHDLSSPLKKAEIPVFTISTYDTDYLFVPGDAFGSAIKVLSSEFIIKQG